MLELNPSEFFYFECTNTPNKNCVKFCMKEVFKCRERRMMWWDEEWTKAQAWGFPCTPRNIQEVQASKLGDAQGIPSSSTKQHVISLCAISLLFHMLCVVLVCVFFVAYGWTPTYLFGERHAPFSLHRTL